MRFQELKKRKIFLFFDSRFLVRPPRSLIALSLITCKTVEIGSEWDKRNEIKILAAEIVDGVFYESSSCRGFFSTFLKNLVKDNVVKS
ncbi:hypothetical protein CEXT_279211 [Caerostris extrusa]|uniref:Uncharacterized protein n=1 Tax=Caerostris extrusa TaxID=172846 RepID=A0AAV4VDP2_CAEEX|nr:hypothetical protein CEXT_279211 [Caerostris extrusa]